jgi:UDP-GlcNAc3NAcA epimerase
MKIITIIGARPQFIKAAVVSRAIKVYRPDISEILIHTGQHFDDNMSAVFFKELDIPEPTHNLGIGGGTHGQNTGRMIEAIEKVLISETPEWVLVYGDTDSTLAGALAAVKLHTPVAHVEAGLRSFNRLMPEEINRVLTDHAGDLLFTPTTTATVNLAAEGITGAKVKQVGDVMYDAALYYSDKAAKASRILEFLDLEPKKYILATIHRQENTDDPSRMKNILDGFAEADLPIIWPMHPRNHSRLAASQLRLPATVKGIDPVGYLDMVMLEKHAALIATDSGGVQKEAYFHQVPCVTLRDETEWVELVHCKANQIAGADSASIAAILKNLFLFPDDGQNLYGDGQSGKLIANSLYC